MHERLRPTLLLTLVTLLPLVLMGCEERMEPEEPPATIGPHRPVQIETLLAHTADAVPAASLSYFAYHDIPDVADWSRLGVELAVEDYGPLHGHPVHLGAPHDTGCTAYGANHHAHRIATEQTAVGVIGTTCSIAAYEAARILSHADIPLISPTNTAPSLTSNLMDQPGFDNYPGYSRTALNDLHQAQAAAHFFIQRLGPHNVLVVNDGSRYSITMGQTFTHTYERLGGTFTDFTMQPGQTALSTEQIEELTEGDFSAFFLPIFEPEAHVLYDFLSQAYPALDELQDLVEPNTEQLADPDQTLYADAYLTYLTAYDAYITYLPLTSNLRPPPAFSTTPLNDGQYHSLINRYKAYLDALGASTVLPTPYGLDEAFQRRYDSAARAYQQRLETLASDIPHTILTPPDRVRLMDAEYPSYPLAYVAYLQANELYLDRLSENSPITPPPTLDPEPGDRNDNSHYQERITTYNTYRAENGQLPTLEVPQPVLAAFQDIHQNQLALHASHTQWANNEIRTINRNLGDDAEHLPQADLLTPSRLDPQDFADPGQTVYALAFMVYIEVYYTYLNAVRAIAFPEGPQTSDERAIVINAIAGVSPELTFEILPDDDDDNPYNPIPRTYVYPWDAPKPIRINQRFYQPQDLLARGCAEEQITNCGYLRRLHFTYARYLTTFENELAYHVHPDVYQGFWLEYARISQKEHDSRVGLPGVIGSPATFDPAHVDDPDYQKAYFVYLQAYETYLDALAAQPDATPPQPMPDNASFRSFIDVYTDYLARYRTTPDLNPLPQVTSHHQQLYDAVRRRRAALEADTLQIDPHHLHRLRAAPRVATSVLLVDDFLSHPLSRGTYVVGPNLSINNTRNQATGKSLDEVRQALQERLERQRGATTPEERLAIYDGITENPYWAHAYDAATLLLEALRESARNDTAGRLTYKPEHVREALLSTNGFHGLSGILTCDPFGDCAPGNIVVYRHVNPVPLDSSLIVDPRTYFEEAYVTRNTPLPPPEDDTAEETP